LLRIAAALLLGVTLAACSDSNIDRRDTIALSGGNAVATDEATQMVDPWPRASANKNIAFNGQKMQSAVQRYRENKVTPPSSPGTTSAYAPSAAPQTASTGGNASPVGPSVTQP
jgi:hypothetical protein